MTNRIEKVVDIKNGKIIFRKVPNGYITFFQIIYIIVNEENKPKKRLKFSMWDDFQFEGAPKEYELFKLEKIDFDIEKENILYGPIKRFLGEDTEFILDDDATWGINNKVMKISENKDDIKIEFINNGKGQEEQGKLDKYKIFIKNIIFDGRSKLDDTLDSKTKERLRNLFLDLRSTIAGKEELEDIILKDKLYYLDENMLFTIIPELKDCIGFDQKNRYHIYDVWEHILKALQKSNNDLETRLAVLLHDIGKPHSYQEDGAIRHFKGHAQKSAQMAKEILTRLGYEEKQIEDIYFLIANHAKTIDIDSVNEENLEITKKLLHIQYCDAYAYNPQYLRDVLDKLDTIHRRLEIKEKAINSEKSKER